jgi:DNA-binding LacI/PurR family transcriptional regulator/signal transduction histidine kinase
MFLAGLQLEWQGVVDMAREQDANVICFRGGAMHSPHEFESQANVLYDLVSAERLDGLVIWSSNVALYLTPEETTEFLARYHPLPAISCQYAAPGVPSVLQLDAHGVREAIVHLVKVHGCRRIAFLRGPEAHFGAQARYQGYVDALRELGMPLNPNIVSSPVEWSDGAMAIAALLDERKLRPMADFDAIIAPSDSIMLTAMTALQAREISIPGQVAVVGFDDSLEAGMAMPALTSVVTPFYELGRQAVVLLLARLDGRQIPERTYLPSALIVRQSCGCLPRTGNQGDARRASPYGERPGTAAEQRECMLAGMQRAVGSHEPQKTWTVLLLDSFVADMDGQASHLFLNELSEVLRHVMDSDGDVIVWDSALSALRTEVLASLSPELRARAEDLLHQARMVVGESAARMSARRTYRTQQYVQTLRNIAAELITMFDMDELMNFLAQSLPRLGIPSCYLAVYDDPSRPAGWSHLLMAYDERGRIPIDSHKQHYPSRELIPEELWPQHRRFSLVVEPLFVREHQLGYAVFEIGHVEPSVYEELRAQISSALQGAILVQSLQQRSAQLETANKELEAFANSVSHDLRAPLRAIDGFSQLLLERNHEQLDKEGKNYLERVRRGAQWMGQLIDALLALSHVSRTAMTRQRTHLSEMALRILKGLQEANPERKVECVVGTGLEVWGDRRLFQIVLENLLGNSWKYTAKHPTARIEFGVTWQEKRRTFFVRDDGAGFDMQYVDKLFGPFQRLHTTTEFPGTGIGLATVQRIIRRHGGHVWAEGAVEKGATIYFTIP